MISRQNVLRRRDGHHHVAVGSPWRSDDLVLPRDPSVGRYGDALWVFPPDRDSGRPTRIHFDDPDFFPNREWRQLARDLAMALLGRRPGRPEVVRSRQKPITVAQVIRRTGLVGRWAEATGHGLPTQWTSETVDAFLLAYNDSRLPNRVAADNPKSSAATRQTLAAYLNLIAMLHEHRNQLAHGMPRPPWANWPSIGAYEVAGVAEDAEARTEIIDPDTWWAAVRAALRIVNDWAPDILAAWTAYHHANRRRIDRPWGPELRSTIVEWAARSDSLLPVDRDGRPSWDTVAAWCGIGRFRGDRPFLRQVADRLISQGRTTRRWWPPPAADDAKPPTWLDRMGDDDVFSLAATLRNAALVILAALSAMRNSEMEELRQGCVRFHDGSWALTSTIQKHQQTPAPGTWWVTPMAVHAIQVLEDLVAPLDVFVLGRNGQRTPTDHLVCTLGRTNYGRAGLAQGSRPFENFTRCIDDHADDFGFDPIGATVTPHQFRRTFAVVAAWQPDGHVAVELQLKDTAEVAAGYYANQDRRWFDAYEFAKAEALSHRLRSHVVDGLAPDLAGPAGANFAAAAQTVFEAGNIPTLDALGTISAHEQAATTLAGRHACGDGWDCAGDLRNARCLAVRAARHGDPFTAGPPQAASGLCFDLGADPDRACGNVILDPAAHLGFWDVEAARLRADIDTTADQQPLLRQRLELELAGAEASITEMEAACRQHPARLLRRFEDERLRLLERIADDHHAPGTAALYRPLLTAQEQRITWLRTITEAAP